MKYTNLNPKLTSEVLELAGFTFDGYYRVHSVAPIKLLPAEDEGYDVYLEGLPVAAEQRIKVSTYCQLIALLQSVSQFYIDSKVNEAMHANPNLNPLEVLAAELRNYWGFDQNLAFAIQIHPNGAVAISPNNEYTLSVSSNNIHKFSIYCFESGHADTTAVVDIEADPSVISYSYAYQAAKELSSLEHPMIDHIDIYLFDEAIGDLIPEPFFGAGMRKINNEQSTQQTQETL